MEMVLIWRLCRHWSLPMIAGEVGAIAVEGVDEVNEVDVAGCA